MTDNVPFDHPLFEEIIAEAGRTLNTEGPRLFSIRSTAAIAARLAAVDPPHWSTDPKSIRGVVVELEKRVFRAEARIAANTERIETHTHPVEGRHVSPEALRTGTPYLAQTADTKPAEMLHDIEPGPPRCNVADEVRALHERLPHLRSPEDTAAHIAGLILRHPDVYQALEFVAEKYGYVGDMSYGPIAQTIDALTSQGKGGAK